MTKLKAIFTSSVDVCAMFYRQSSDSNIVMSSGPDQQRLAVPVSGVDTGLVFQKRFNNVGPNGLLLSRYDEGGRF